MIRARVLAAGAIALGAILPAVTSAEKSFDTPEAAVIALVQAIEKGDRKAVESIVGKDLRAAFVEDVKRADEGAVRAAAVRAAKRQSTIEPDPTVPGHKIWYLGEAEWPFPAPLVPHGTKWRFDGKAGLEELHARRIGRNELFAMAACVGYVDAQLEYSSDDYDDDGILEYSPKIVSTAGKRDGLYWSTDDGEEESLIGPFGALAARGEVVPGGKPEPLAGYWFRVLTAQGSHARGGARDYRVGNDVLGGFALVAYPAQYGVTGIKTFIVNQLGEVYERDLGPSTESVASALTAYDPDSSWNRVIDDLRVALEETEDEVD
ncbi:MAG: DUF2950 family protein [Candidatus Eiseniibacteriota bacterium]